MSQFRQPMNISTPDNIQSNEIYKHEKHTYYYSAVSASVGLSTGFRYLER